MPRIIVIGGGITGLAAAHRLMELAAGRSTPLELQVLEAAPRLGGIVKTLHQDSYLLEEGPDSFITDKPAALALAKRVGLERQLIPTNPARRSHVLWQDKLHPIPEGFALMAPGKLKTIFDSTLFTASGKARIGMERFIPSRKGKSDESVDSFVRRRLGDQAMDRLVQPLVSGIYGGDPRQLSMQALFPRFLDMEAEHGSLTAARSAQTEDEGVSGARYSLFMTLKDGMSALVNALAAKLPNGAALVNSAVQKIERVGGRWDVTLDTGHKTSADGVLVALPAPKAARLMAPLDQGVADTLTGIKYAPSASIYFAYPWASLSGVPEGFGFVVPAAERKCILGCTFASAKFPGRSPKEVALLRAFVAPTHLDVEEEELIQKVEGALRSALGGLKGRTYFTAFRRHGPVLPQYEVGHAERIAALDWRVKIIPRLAVAGNAYRGLGLPDCIQSAEDAAELLMAKLAQPSHV